MLRCSGIFLHPTSLPSPFGIGDLGGAAFHFAAMLRDCGQSYWQVCPLGPTGYGDSPYQSLCSFAGNPLLISPAKLREVGLLDKADLESYPSAPEDHVDFGLVIAEKDRLFRKAFTRFEDSPEFDDFCQREQRWLEDYSLYRVIKDTQRGQPWYLWDAPLRLRFPAKLDEMKRMYGERVRYHKFLQFQFDRQWRELRAYCRDNGLRVMGDIPFYVAYDSSDMWSSPELFELDQDGRPLRVAGVPPDYFSETGQLWGNPVYRWDAMKLDSYSWWTDRVRKAFEIFDTVRLDHFRGFESYWAVEAGAGDARRGQWLAGPGMPFFKELRNRLGEVSLVAEDLGVITERVTNLRYQAGLPGMKVLQFAFDRSPTNPYLTYNVQPDSVLYTGTHDNDTSVGWFESLLPEARRYVLEYLGCAIEEFVESFIRHAFQSPARLSVIPLQDALGLGSEHRLNKPGVGEGNWQWRVTKDLLTTDRLEMLRQFTSLYGRAPRKDAGLRGA